MKSPRLLQSTDALFLDLDGTLAPIEASPELVVPVERRSRLLGGLQDRLGGALAILSGRTVDDIDRILEARCEAVAGVHGLARRSTIGGIVESPPDQALDHARALLEPFVASRPGLLLEHKGQALAVHFRGAPEAGEAVRDLCMRIAGLNDLVVQEGKMVCELRTAGPSKGDALNAFLLEETFRGRFPIMVGDDLTDEHAFRAAEEAGGFGVLVGPERPSAARHRLATVEAVLDWLEASLGGSDA